MERRVNISTWQKVSRDDFLKFGTFPQASLDTIIGKLLIPDMAFEGFAVVQSGPAEVTVGKGHLFNLGLDYVNDTDGGTPIDLLSRLPAVTKRIVAITVWGTEIDSKLEPRTFLIDAETRATEARETSTEHWRWANIGIVAGVEGPDPQHPAVAADVCPVAWVTLTTAGVESIQRNTSLMAPTLRGEDNRLNAIDLWRTVIGTLIDTLRSDLAALAARIIGFAQFDLVKAIARDVARLKDDARVPQTFIAYAFDHFLTETGSDPEHVDWLARIEEGVRFPPAAVEDDQLGLLNPLDELVINSSNLLLPAWDSISRIVNVGTDKEMSIAQYTYQTVTMVQKTMARQVTRYGTPFTVCTNASAWWNTGVFDWISGTFKRGSEVFVALDSNSYAIGENWRDSHSYMRLQQVWQDTYFEPYWDKITTTSAISGSILAQTFLNAQDGWLSKINLYFSRVAGTGNVTMLLCELTNGSPDITKVIAQSTVLAADLKLSPAGEGRVATSFNFIPTFLRKGRYGFILVTSGNHYVWTLQNTNYVAGTLFYSTDGLWFQGDITLDVAFEAFFCKFRTNTTHVQLQGLQLSGGIAAININADTIIPDSCELHYQIQVAGEWHDLDNVDGGPSVQFIGLPPLLPFRAKFVGTDSVQPGLGVAVNSRVQTWRPRADFKHISAIRTIPSSTVFDVQVRLEAWRGAPYHTFTCKLMHGASYSTLTDPTTTSEVAAPDDPTNAIIRTYHFSGMGALTSFRLRFDGGTDNVLTTFHVAERFDIET